MPSTDRIVRLIINPVAANGNASRTARELIASMAARDIPHVIRETKGRGDASTIAADWVHEGADSVWCLGGDGTVQETAQGLAGTETALGIIPGGTGNDFASMFGLAAGDPWRALNVQLGATPHRVDAAMVNDRWFINICGMGFDVDTLIHTEKAKRYSKGMLAYLIGVSRAIATHKDITVEITADGQTTEQKLLMVAVCNGRRFGGGMNVAPEASITDGLFDLILIHPVSKLGILRLLPGFIKGKHLSLPMVELKRCSDVRIVQGADTMTVNVDGELMRCNDVRFHIQPMALNVLAPG